MQSESKQPNLQVQSSIIQANIIVLRNGFLDVALRLKEIMDASSFSLPDLQKIKAQFEQHVIPKTRNEWFEPLSPIAIELKFIIRDLVTYREKYAKGKLTKQVTTFIDNVNNIIKNMADLTKNSSYVAKLVALESHADAIVSHYNPKEKKAKKLGATRKAKMQELLASLAQVKLGNMHPEQLENVIQKEITAFLDTKHGVLFKSKYTQQKFEALDRSHEYAYFLKTLRDGLVDLKVSLLKDLSTMVTNRGAKEVETKEPSKAMAAKRM